MEETQIHIGFIGCGRVGTSLAKYFTEKGLSVIGMFDRTISTGKDSCDFVQTAYYSDKNKLIQDSDVIFITVSDSAIRSVWNEITSDFIHDKSDGLNISDKIFVHCSGAIASDIFSTDNQTVTLCSLHPAQAFCDKYQSYKDLPQTVFTLEYDNRRNCSQISRIEYILTTIGNKYAKIDCACKVKYHAACVMASNLVVALSNFAMNTLSECNIPEETAQQLLGSLLVGNAQNILEKGTVNALTGPIDRADTTTVRCHLDQLSGETKRIYIELSKKLVEIAKIKNPEKNYEETENLLRKFSQQSLK